MQIKPPLPLSSCSTRAYVLPEVMVGFGVLMIALAAAFNVNSQIATNVRTQRETAAANRALVEMIERLRAGSFLRVTDQSYLKNTVLGTFPSSSTALPALSVRVTVNAYPPNTSPTLQVTRQGSSSTIDSANPNLASGLAVRADVRITWTGAGGRQRIRETSIVVTKGGIGT